MPALATRDAIQTIGLTKRFGRTLALDQLNLTVEAECIAAAVARGQTVFLSSHHLAEVEAVCQRVGILREGRLVGVAELSDLRRLRFTEVDVSFRGTPLISSSCPRCRE